MMGAFKGDREELGHRLGQIRRLGATGLGRLYVEQPEARPLAGARVTVDIGAAERLPPANSNRKVGRPKVEGVRPWDAEGISRAVWFRRKKAAGG